MAEAKKESEGHRGQKEERPRQARRKQGLRPDVSDDTLGAYFRQKESKVVTTSVRG